jgi:membrane-bound serine protease (ClpP class)
MDEAEVPVAVLVAPQAGIDARAAGAWAALWSAADVRAVAEVATVGPVVPTDLAGDGESPAVVEDVSARLGAAGAAVLDNELDAATLEDAGVVDVNAPDVVTMLGDLDGRDVGDGRVLSLPQDEVQVRLHSLGLVARMLHAAATPAFIYLLLVIGLSLLAFELFQPGFGVAGIAGLVMLPFAIFGLTVLPVTWWALLLLLVGLGLYVLDTALAGLGVRTLAATVAFGVGSWWVFGTGPLRNPGWVAGATTALALAFWVVVMTTILRAQAGPEGVELDDMVGRPGIVRSVLNPEGHVYIDEALWRARLEGSGRLKVGSAVQVVAVDGAVLVVDAFDPSRRPATASAGDPGRAGSDDDGA